MKFKFPRVLSTAGIGLLAASLPQTAFAQSVNQTAQSPIAAFFYQLFMGLGALAMLACIAGYFRPDLFRPLFKARSSKGMVCGVFGAVLLLFAGLGSSLEPKPVVTPEESTNRGTQFDMEDQRRPISQENPTSQAPIPVKNVGTRQIRKRVKPSTPPALGGGPLPPIQIPPIHIPTNEGLLFPNLYRQTPTITTETHNLRGKVKQVVVEVVEEAKIKSIKGAFYDKSGKLQQEVKLREDPKTPQRHVESGTVYDYDPQGQLSTISEFKGEPQTSGDRRSVHQFSYQDGRLKSETYSTEDGGYTYTYELGPFGPTSMIAIGQPTGHKSVEYMVYHRGLLVERRSSNGSRLQFHYAGASLTSWSDSTGSKNDFQYWDNGYVKKATQRFSKPSPYQALGQVVTFYNERGLETRSIAYQSSGALDHEWRYRYVYDAQGNWIKKLSLAPRGTNYLRDITYY